MALILGPKAQSQDKMIPNGGLGGLVRHGCDVGAQTFGNTEPRPVQRYHDRRPPLRISVGCKVSTASPALYSAPSSLGLGGLFTPRTPTDRKKCSLWGSDAGCDPSPISSRYFTAIPNNMLASPPETPISPEPFSMAELPGSLLLASQGFAQSLPISPPPSLRLLRRDTEDSFTSSAPSLSISVSSEEGRMETLRNLTTRKYDRSHRDMPSSYTIGSRAPAVSKPLAVMTVEELLDILPDCNGEVVSKQWLPAMRMQIEKMITVLNEAGNLQIDRAVDQVTLNNLLKTFSNQLLAIAADYRRVVTAAESLAERDAKIKDERVEGFENRIEEAVGLLEVKDKEIERKTRQAEVLRDTLRDVSRVLGAFIQDNVPGWADNMTNPNTIRAMQIVADYSRFNNPGSVNYVRVPEETLNKHVSDLDASRNLVGEFRKVLNGQQAMIKAQSQDLDANLRKYEKAAMQVQEKDHEILLLAQRNSDLIRRLQDMEVALAESRDTATEAEITGRQYDELRGNMQSLKTAHELELDQKDAEIAVIRQKLGSAREEVFARREDVKNVVAQSQAMRQHDSQATLAVTAKPNSSTSKALRFFGMERDKIKKGGIPNSVSSVDIRYSTKEVVPPVSKEALRNRSSLQTQSNPRFARTMPNTPVVSFQDPSGFDGANFAARPFSDSRGSVPPHSDSLGAPQHYTSNPPSPVAPPDRFKPLPENPVSKSQLATARLADVIQPIESPLQAQITSDYLTHGIMGQTSQTARRVLSKISEVSTPKSRRSAEDIQGTKLQRVDEDNNSDHSVASSDRSVYRNSISALDMLNTSSNLTYSGTETDLERIMRATGIAAGTGSGNSQPRSLNRRGAATQTTAKLMHEDDDENVDEGVARVLHMRTGNGNLRRAGGTHDGIIEDECPRDPLNSRRQFGVIGEGKPERRPPYPRDRESSGESTRDRRERFQHPARESMASNGSSSGYRTEDSEPKTVAQMYHSGGKHIRG